MMLRTPVKSNSDVTKIFSLLMVGIFRKTDSQMESPEDTSYSRLFIGGSEVASIEDAPFTIMLAITLDSDSIRAICTGSIIHENWVLTAGHCVIGIPMRYFRVKVVAGSDDAKEVEKVFKNGTDPQTGDGNRTIQIRRLIRAIPHPRCKTEREVPDIQNLIAARFDFALLKVAQLSFGPRVNKINLFDEEWNGDKASGKEYKTLECKSYGWGKTADNSKTSPNLRTASFKVLHGYGACDCLKPYTNRRLLCTSPNKGEVTLCPGDSGGPIVCKNKVAGVAHIGYHAGQCLFQPFKAQPFGQGTFCGGRGLVSAWMYVCPVLDWIGEYVPGTPGKPPSCKSPPLMRALSLLTYAVLIINVV